MQPNYSVCVNKAYAVLAECADRKFPVNLNEIVENEHGLKLYKYSDLCKNQNLTLREAIDCVGSEYAGLVRRVDTTTLNYRFLIFYNDTLENEGLIRFSIAHELGHFYMGHCSLLHEYGSSNIGFDLLDSVFQREADCFARNLLSPALVFGALVCGGGYFPHKVPLGLIKNIFKISNTAAEVRRDFFLKDLNDTLPHHKYIFSPWSITNARCCKKCSLYEVAENQHESIRCKICHLGTLDENQRFSKKSAV